jgi:hypothetical protein
MLRSYGGLASRFSYQNVSCVPPSTQNVLQNLVGPIPRADLDAVEPLPLLAN